MRKAVYEKIYAAKAAAFHMPDGSDSRLEQVAISRICSAVARRYGMPETMLRRRNNSPEFSHPRALVCYLARRLGDHSFPKIGRCVNLHHTSAYSAYMKVKIGEQNNEDLARLIKSLIEELRAPIQLKLPRASISQESFEVPELRPTRAPDQGVQIHDAWARRKSATAS